MGRRHRKRKEDNGKTTILSNNQDQISKFYKIEISDVMGRFIIAKTDIPAGTMLLNEGPLIIGPSQGTAPVCIACYKPIQISNCSRCESCGWPLCQSNCENIGNDFGHTKQECDILKQSKVQPFEDNSLYNVLTPLRILLLNKHNENSWRIIQSMEAHSAIRQKTDMWKKDQNIIHFLKKNFKQHELTDEDIHSICGYIQVNGFGVEGKDVTALYPSAFLFSHDCTPNTTHVISNDFHIGLRSTMHIKKGDPITISYCNTLHGTLWRRGQLQGSKFFGCSCKRCSDKTEFGTWLSAIKCKKCTLGYLLSNDPLEAAATWNCNKCDSNKQKYIIYEYVNMLLEEVEELTYKSIDEIEKVLKKNEESLHPNHFINLLIKLKLSQLYGKTQDCMIHNMSEDKLRRKMDICKEIIKIFNVIEPGLSRIRGITLYELHAPTLILGTNDFKKTNNINKFKQTLKDVKKFLYEANIILSIEDPTSTEGLIGKAAADALKQMES